MPKFIHNAYGMPCLGMPSHQESSEKDAICEVTLAVTALASFINMLGLCQINTQHQKKKHLFDSIVT